MYSETCIVSSVRTAVGKAGRGTLRNVRPESMGAAAVNGAMARVEGLPPERVDDVIMGCAFPEAQQGMVLGRVVARKAGLPETVPGVTINRFCASGLQSIAMAHQAISAGQADVIVAGGAESMSLVPMGGNHFMPDPDVTRENPDLYIDMGNTAENLAESEDISRVEQDEFALRSHHRALNAAAGGRFNDEIVPMHVVDTVYENGGATSTETTFRADEGPRADTSAAALARLRPVFRARGTVTAGNASQVSDGAAATVVMSERTARELDVEPLARLAGYAVAGVAPEIMGIGPAEAVPKALRQAGLALDDIGLIELNEAFAVQALAVIGRLGLDRDIVNVNGGAIALGHPLGCTGAKLTATLLHEMIRRNIRYGICTMCIGSGMGAAGVFENLRT